jgi:hypothetical protein
MKATLAKMKARIASKSDAVIVEAVELIGGSTVSTEAALVRALLISEYEARHGENAADALMDRIGL